MPRMTGNHISINSTGGQYFFIDWQLAGQDVTNNYSAINWQAYFHYNSADAQLDNGIAGLSGTRWNNGGRVKNFEGRFVTRDVILASGSFNIGHNADGTQGISVSGGVDVYKSGRSAGSQWFGLPTIPRNSQVTTNDSGGWHIGTPLTIYTNRKSSSFTHTITIRLGGSGGTVLQTINSIGDSVAWTPSAEQIAQIQNSIPNDNRALIHITQYNNQVGQNSTTQAWNYIRDANPIFNDFTYKDSNASVATITGNDQVLVKGKSTLQVTVPSGDKMVAQKGANPDYYAFAFDGVSNNLSYSTSNVNSSFTNIDTVGSRAILVTAYDTRTNNTRVAKNIQVYDYTPPNIEFEVTRENNFGEDVTIETGGTFDLLPINGVNKNSITASSLKYRYKEKGAATWGAWANIPFTVTDDGFAGTNQFISLDNTKEFELEFQVADKFGTHTQATELGAGTPILFVGRHSNGDPAVGIGSMPDGNALLTINGKSLGDMFYPVGSTYFNKTNSTNPATLLGFGTWARLEGVVLGGRSETTGSPFNVTAGTVIGADNHTLTVGQMPTHSHDFYTNAVGGTTANSATFAGINGVANGAMSSTGGGQAHPNIQRTLVGYLWERTA